MATPHKTDEMVDMEPISTEPHHSEPASSELVQSQPTSSEPASSQLIHPESVGSEPVHSEVIHPEPVGSEMINSQPYNSEAVHPEPGSSEASHSELVSSEPVHTEPVGSEVAHSQPVSLEPAASEVVNSELIHSQAASDEQVNFEAVSSELRHSQAQPVNVECVHSEPVSTVEESVHSEPASMVVESVTLEPVCTVEESVHSELVSTVAESVHSDQMSTELTHPQPVSAHSNHTELVGSELMHPEPISSEPINAEKTDSHQAHQQPADAEPFNSEPGNPEMMSIDPMSLDHSHLQSAGTETVNSEPMSSEVVHSKAVGSEIVYPHDAGSEEVHLDAVSSGPANMNLTKSERVHKEAAISEQVHVESAISELVHSEPASSEAVHSGPAGSEPVHSRPVGEEQVHSQPASAEQVHSQEHDHSHSFHPQPMNVEFMSSELAHSLPENIEAANSQLIKAERIGTEPMSSEHTHSESFSAEFMSTDRMITEPMSLGLAHPQPIGPELDYSQPFSSELMHSQPLSSEMINLQQVHSELIHSQPVSSELIHSQPVGTELAHLQSVSSELVPSQGINFEPVNLQPIGSEPVNSQLVNSELANLQLVNSEVANSEQVSPETQPNKRRKKKSIVWEHFTIETVGAGCRRACCKVCKQSFAYSTGSKVAGTSHLKRHIAKGTCPVILRQQERNQLTPYMPKSGGTEGSTEAPKRRYRSSSTPYLIFDQDRCRHEIARMIIMHDYPLHMVEHPGFVAFVQNLQPRFDMVNFNTVQGDCVATYLREKQKLQKFIDGLPGRICLALDVWTSNQTTCYVFLTGQFIDNDWKLHRRLLNVVMEPFPESDTALSHAVATCLSYWNLENRLSAVTVNQSLTDSALENLRALISVKNSRILNGQLLIGNCIARTLSGMAQEVLTAGQETIKKIRASVKYVKTSESHEEKFLELKQQLQVPTEKSLSLDNLTQWNTTYDMLLAAAELKEVFSCLDTSDPEYGDAPSMEDWKQVENLCAQLKLLYDTANLLTTKTNPPTNVFFHEVWKIQLELARTAASDDPFVRHLAKSMQETFQKYWRDCCLVLAIAVAMDPRFKMKLVEFSFTKIFGEQAPAYIRVVDEGIHELFIEYMMLPLPLTPAYAEDGNGMNVKMEQHDGGNLLSSNGLSDFDMYIMETTSQQSKSELDQYLEESLLPRVQDFDVLGWWKLNKLKYPTLSKMARDVLSVPLCSVGPDSVFYSISREMDQYRSSLRPETMEALICAKDWLQYEPSEVSNAIVKMEL
ncbi:hypothetical protein Ancab_040288 [Ancistrocladus abbreviatus]